MDELSKFRKNAWFLIGATRGGPMRARIMGMLIERPLNTNQLAGRLSVDYKTAVHHLEVLKKNAWVTSGKENYGELFFPTFTDGQKQAFLEILGKTGKKY